MQRSKSKFDYISYKLEVSGGKVEDGESYEICLAKKLKKELGIDAMIKLEQYLMTVKYEYPDFAILMWDFLKRSNEYEHIDHKWLAFKELETLDFAQADLLITKKLMREKYE